MDFNHKLDKILKDIKAIENYAVDLSNSDSIPKIEMDILMEKVRNLYDELIRIDHDYPYETPPPSENIPFEYHKEEEKGEADTKQQQARKTEKIQTEETGNKKEEKPDYQSNAEEKQEDKTPGNDQSGETSIRYEDQSVEESQTVDRAGQEKNDIPEILADKYYNTQTSRHENLARKQNQYDLSSKMQAKPIRDLTRAIGLNDRFLFIRELFNGDKEAYYEAVQIINEMPGYQEAEEYIRQRFDWDEEQPEVIRFMELVRRRFVSGQ